MQLIHKLFTPARLALLAALLCLSLCAAAQQQLEVASFTLEENSLTAKNEPVYDNNQQKCALVIVSGMGDEVLRFNVGNSFIKVDERRSGGERVYRMWIPEGVVKLTISSDAGTFKPVEYFFNPRVKKAETYLMKLKLTRQASSLAKQYLEFIVEPATAYLEVDGEPWTLTDGSAYRPLPPGRYSYNIRAKDYHPEAGIVDFSDLSAKRIVEVKLKPAFGWLNVEGAGQGVTVFVDDERVDGNLNHIQLSSGQHTLRATKERHLPYSQTFVVEDEKETPLTVNLTANYANVEIAGGDGVSVYLDGELKGTGTWQGELSPGNYKVELKKDSYRPLTQNITIDKVGQPYKFTFNALQPIYGSANIESTPSHATVLIDGKEYGTTPLFVPELLIGKHNIQLQLAGYQDTIASFDLQEGKQAELAYTLSDKPKVEVAKVELKVTIEDVHWIGEEQLRVKFSNQFNPVLRKAALECAPISERAYANAQVAPAHDNTPYKVEEKKLKYKRKEVKGENGSSKYVASVEYKGTLQQLADDYIEDYIARYLWNYAGVYPDGSLRRERCFEKYTDTTFDRKKFKELVYAQLGLPAPK